MDEEHRFGVKHKEAFQRLSQLNPEGPTEYMAMSATPIPRTLHLAMSGLREVSVLQPHHRVESPFKQDSCDSISKRNRETN